MIGLKLKRWRYRNAATGTPLERCWLAPVPKSGDDWRSIRFLVCDCEMSSLDPLAGELLSIAWVRIEAGEILLGSAQHHYISAQNSVGQSAVIHQIRDCELEQAETAEYALRSLLAAAEGSVLVFHNAVLDLQFLDRASQLCFGAPLLCPVADTLLLEKRRLLRHDKAIASGDLTLTHSRRRYNLPDYPAHNALLDALATAELLIAQARHRSGTSALCLREFF